MHDFLVSFLTAVIVSAAVATTLHFTLPPQSAPAPAPAPAAPVTPPPPPAEPAPKPEASTVEVPNLAGMELETARSYLQTKGLALGKVESVASKVFPAGQVLSSAPDRHTMVNKGTVIEVKVSTGNPAVAVPDLRKFNATKAQKALEAVGLGITIKYAYDEDYGEGRVLRQDPAPGQNVDPGAKVTVVVNNEDYEE